MKILAIDTSGQQAGAAIVDEYITIGEILLNARTGEKAWTHSEILMPGIDQLFKLTRLAPTQIDYVAYTCGPGSFTGLRIGAATAQGLARAWEKPAVAVPTLDALAYNVLGTGCGGLVVPLLDARREQVYAAIYERNVLGQLSKITDYMALPIDEMIHENTARFENAASIIFLGDGADANADLIRQLLPQAIFTPANNNRTRAASVGLCALEMIHSGADTNSDIIYVRAPQAIREATPKKS